MRSRVVRVTKALLAAVLAVAVAVGVWAVFLRDSGGGHGIFVGALEDAVKESNPAAADGRVAQARRAGFDALGVTTLWTPGQTEPSAPELAVLRNAAAAARRSRIRVFLSVFTARSRDTPGTDERQRQFAAYTAVLAR